MMPDPQTIFALLRGVQFARSTYLSDYTCLPNFFRGYRMALSLDLPRITYDHYTQARRDFGINTEFHPSRLLLFSQLMDLKPDLDIDAAVDILFDLEIRAWEYALGVKEERQYFD